jgi:hypothetical protein
MDKVVDTTPIVFDGNQASDQGDAAVLPRTKTPMFTAIHSARYERHALIAQISRKQGKPLICYVCGAETHINRDDTVFFVDLLHNVAKGVGLDLMLHTGGGDLDAAEKLISIVRTWTDKGRLRVIVPDFAKSAGTLMACGADSIVMSDTSELGPIDPQVAMRDTNGNLVRQSVQAYIDAYETHSQALRQNPNDLPSRLMLEKLDPAVLKLMQAAHARSREFAEGQLKSGMFRFEGGNYTSTANELINTKKWLTHGQMIGWQDAKVIGLHVEYVEPTSDTWQDYWRLYCLQRLAIKDHEKLFESDYVHLITEG